jgi:hypothetical protein
MILKPFVDANDEAIASQALIDLLPKNKDEEELNHIQQVFKNKGAGVEDAARTVSMLMNYSERDEIKLRAAETALKIQGMFAEEKKKSIPNIVINIIGSGGENKNLINLVMPAV